MFGYKARIILGFIAGMLGNIPKTIICQLMNKKQVSRLKCNDLLSGMFMNVSRAKTREGGIFSSILDFLVAGVNGVSYQLILLYTGKKHAVGKGWLTGLIEFGLYRGIIVRFGKGKIYSKDFKTNFIQSLTSSVWGISTALISRSIERKLM